MNAKVAIATVSGKSYFLIVNKLRARNIGFISLVPGDPVPTEVRVVITTEKEKEKINHEKKLIFESEAQLDLLLDELVKLLEGKQGYEKIVIGIDPGKVSGLAVIADGKIKETRNCFGIQEIQSTIQEMLKNIDESTAVYIKIGNGVPEYKDLLEALNSALPVKVILEVVSEAGTNRAQKITHRRGMRDIASAICIAGRVGETFIRKRPEFSNS